MVRNIGYLRWRKAEYVSGKSKIKNICRCILIIVLTEKERIMKKKILIALSLIVLIVGYSCQEDLEVVDPMSQDVGKGRLSVAQ